MKKLLSLFLIVLLLQGLCVSALAQEAPSASMKEYHDCFAEAESFGSGSALTRAMTAVILQRFSGEEPGYGISCSDVQAESWYADGAAWAVRSGVLLPRQDGLFDPDATLDREALALALSRFLDAYSLNPPLLNEAEVFTDRTMISAEAQNAATLMQRAGVMLPDGEGNFLPFSTVTVAEAEPVFLRFFESVDRARLPVTPYSSMEESAPVDNAWFDDVCFIGHSLVVGMSNYFDLYNATYHAIVGHKAQDVLDFPYYQMPGRGYGNLRKVMEAVSYGKVYIMLGINDCNPRPTREEEFMVPMRKILDIITETQPEATIYLISLEPVGRVTPMMNSYTLENVILYSQMIKRLSLEYETEYLDVFRLMSDREGYFLEDYGTADGIHIQAKKFPEILDYIKRHTVA